MKRQITKEIKEAVSRATETVLGEYKEVDIYIIKELLEKEYNIKFLNIEMLNKLVIDSLNEIVYIYC